VFISRQSHEAIVALLKAQLDDKDKQIAKLEEDRDFYRSAWTAKQGERFTAATVTTPFTESRSEEQPVRIDANWSPDDRDIFLSWARDRFPPGTNELEMLNHWKEKYGETGPAAIAISGGWGE
jgi:hypothetical protein